MSPHERKRVGQIRRHFRRMDPVLFPVIAKMELEPLRTNCGPADYFPKLCREILSQQLADTAARAIRERFLNLFPRQHLTPERLLAFSAKKLRATGMSWAKARYLHDLAQKTAAGEIRFSRFPDMNDETVIAELTKVKGIGPWTAEMFLIFTLGREDVFSFGDLGLRRAFARLYGKRQARMRPPERYRSVRAGMAAIVERWSPYRSYACLALWHIWDSVK